MHRLGITYSIVALMSACLLVACTADGPYAGGPHPWPVLLSTETGALDGPITVLGDGIEPIPSEWSLVEWPELTVVPTSPTDLVETYPRRWSLELIPNAPLSHRWYAVRWSGVDAPVLGTPLADGTVVWRFYGGLVPDVAHVTLVAPDTLSFWFTVDVQPEIGRDLDEVFSVWRDHGSFSSEIPCHPAPSTATPTRTIDLVCEGMTDWAFQVNIDVEGLVSRDGTRLEPSFAVAAANFGESPTWSGGRYLYPPPIPTALCTSTYDCECAYGCE